MKSIIATLALSSLLAAPAFAADAAKAAAPKLDLERGKAVYTQVCSSCHGLDGNSGVPINPKLSAQHPEYTVKQLHEFKSGKRANPIMMPLATALSEADKLNIAHYLASAKPKAGFAKDKALVALGEKIYRGGIAERNVPACAGCHSPNGAGLPAQYPRLAGQHADYVNAQMLGFRDGGRANSSQMTQVAAKMNNREIKAVSDYIAGLR
jgi:cytochrome c553